MNSQRHIDKHKCKSNRDKTEDKQPSKLKKFMRKTLPVAEAALSVALITGAVSGCEKSYGRQSCGDAYEDIVRDLPMNEGDEVSVGNITVRLSEITDSEIRYDFLCGGEVIASNSRSRDFFYDPETTVALQTDFEGFTVLILQENADFENKKVDLTIIVAPTAD